MTIQLVENRRNIRNRVKVLQKRGRKKGKKKMSELEQYAIFGEKGKKIASADACNIER